MPRKPNLNDPRYRNIREVRGKYRVVLEVCASPRRQAQKSFPVSPAGIRAAIEWRDVTLGKIAAGDFEPTGVTGRAAAAEGASSGLAGSSEGGPISSGSTFADLAERWLDSKVGEVRPNTIAGYRSALARPCAYFGDLPLADLGVEEVYGLRTSLLTEPAPRTGRPASHRTVAYTLLAVRLVLGYGVTIKALDHNPGAEVKTPRKSHLKSREGKAPEVTWTREELRRFVTYLIEEGPCSAAGSRDSRGRQRFEGWTCVAFLLSACGLRRGEVLGLTWGNIDLDAGAVTIEASRTRTGGEKGETDRDDPKRPASARVIRPDDLHPRANVMQHLADLKVRQEKARAEAGLADTEPGPADLVVVGPTGAPVDPDRFSATFRRLCSAAEVRLCKTHRLRHALANLLHDAGVPPKRAASLLGHSVEVHLSTYVTATEDGTDDAGRALGRALWD